MSMKNTSTTKSLVAILIAAAMLATSNNASAWSYSRTSSGTYNGNSYSRSVYASGNRSYYGGGGCGGGYGGGGCGGYGGWYGTGIPNGLGWTMFGLAAAGAILGAGAPPPPQPMPYPVPVGYIPVAAPAAVSIVPQAAPAYCAPRQPVVYYNY